jgi:hypothetical protein
MVVNGSKCRERQAAVSNCMDLGVLYGSGCIVGVWVYCMGLGVLYGSGCIVWIWVYCMGLGVLYGSVVALGVYCPAPS